MNQTARLSSGTQRQPLTVTQKQRSRMTLGVGCLALLLVLGLAGGVFAQDSARTAWDQVSKWMTDNTPKKRTRSAMKKYHRSVVKKLEGFLEKYPDYSDKARVELLLGETFMAMPSYSKALKLFKDMAASEGDRGILGRVGVLKAYCAQRKLSTARKVLDGYLEKHPDETSLLEFDKFLQGTEKSKKRKDSFKRLKRGKPFPSFAGKTLGGETWDLSKNKGSKATLISFWMGYNQGKVVKVGAQEMAIAKKLYEKYKDQGLVVVGVAMDRDADKLKALCEKIGIAWPQLANGHRLIQDLGVDHLPNWVLLDKNGKVIAKDLRQIKLERTVDKAMK